MTQREPLWQPGERERAVRRCREALLDGLWRRDAVSRFGHRVTEAALASLTPEEEARHAKAVATQVRREGGRLARAIAKHRAR